MRNRTPMPLALDLLFTVTIAALLFLGALVLWGSVPAALFSVAYGIVFFVAVVSFLTRRAGGP